MTKPSDAEPAAEAVFELPLAFFQAAGGGYDPSFIAASSGRPGPSRAETRHVQLALLPPTHERPAGCSAQAGLGKFIDEVVKRPDVQSMIKRIKFYVDPASENASFDKMTSIIRIHLKGGKVLTGQADFANWPAAKANVLIEGVKALEA
jgi:hypothetical protein